MPDREKVIKGLEHHTNLGIGCTGCPYNGDCHQLPKDALKLLEEQEPVKVFHLHGTKISMNEEIVFTDQCEYCGGYVLKLWKACPICGKRLKWDA